LLTTPKETPEETNEYYKAALDPLFKRLEIPAYITVGRWSYAPDVINPRVFNAGGVGRLDTRSIAALDQEFGSNKFRNALREFSFTKLLADSDQEIWFHFTDENLPAKGEQQVYLSPAGGSKRTPVLEVAAPKVTPAVVNQLINVLETETPLNQYGGVPLHEKKQAISDTLNAAIFSLFTNPECTVRHVSFMPVTMPSARRNVVGIISMNSATHIKAQEFEPILQPLVEGIMAPFHLQEIDEQRRMFSLRSAIAAIMSRNMSHNIGSHVLWHLSQQLK
jgi:hypothetical protein